MSLRKITLSQPFVQQVCWPDVAVLIPFTQFTDAGDLIATSGWATAHSQKVMTEGQYFGIELSRRFASEVKRPSFCIEQRHIGWIRAGYSA